MEQQTREVKIQIKANDTILTGQYANNLMIHMNREEFVLDFINLVPPHATLNGRVIVSPGNLKKMMIAIQKTVEQYEKEFGQLQVMAQAPIPPAEFIQ